MRIESRSFSRLRAWPSRLDPGAARDVRRAFLGSRALVLAAAAVGTITFTYRRHVAVDPRFGHPFHSWPLGGLLDFVFTPLVRWDATWYLWISQQGYSHPTLSVFFPGYPAVVRAAGGFAGPGAAVIAATVVSLAAFLAGLYLLHRLTALELGSGAARATVLLLAFAPVAFYFSAPYSESLFLLESVAALYAARTGHWAAAGALAAAASATRNTGVLLVLPLLMLGLRDVGGRIRPRRQLLWIALAPAGLLAFMAHLHSVWGDAFAWENVQRDFGRASVVTPFEGAWKGTVAAYHAVENHVVGVHALSAHDLRMPLMLEWCFLVFAIVAIVGALRALPAAYGVYSTALLLPPLTRPALGEPLRSFPRYVLVAFPLWMWIGYVCHRRGTTGQVVVGSAAALAFLTAGFATFRQLV